MIECWMEHPVRKLDTTFTYWTDEPAQSGCRVRLTLRNRSVIGFIDSVQESDETPDELSKRLGYTVRKADAVLDEVPLITPELRDLALWMREKTVSTAIACFQAMLPAKVKPAAGRSEAVRERYVKVSEEETKLTPKQLEAFLYVRDHDEVKYSDLRSKYPGQAKALVDKGALIAYEKEKTAESTVHTASQQPHTLNPYQQKIMDEIEQSDDPVFLLRGVTGSGKTEIYFHLARHVLDEGRQVLLLVPEIALTPQMIQRVYDRFGEDLAVYHSGLNPQEKYEQYRKVRTRQAKIVVGTRSAVFLPFHDLGLIVMDEEHDSSYKQDSQPAYHCRDAAIWRGAYHHARVILGSATPSLESYARGIRGVYHLLKLDHRVNDTLPKVTLVNMKEAVQRGESYILSETLQGKMEEVLANGRQVILLLNRRGYHARLSCRACQEVITCPHCDLAMSWHRESRSMKCHTCGTEIRVPRICPKCGSDSGFTAYGYGTQKLEEEVQMRFPGRKVLRMDADTTARKNGHEEILKAFGRHEADILLGTQMIAKGLDYPDVTLVGVLNGDDGLARTDFRSCETTFDLLMQAAGRSGRAQDHGEVVFQVYHPDHYAVSCAAQQDYESFFVNEMHFRHAGMYPPYTYMIAVTFSGMDPSRTEAAAMEFKRALSGNFKVIGVLQLLRINDRSRCRILLKGKDPQEMRTAVRKVLDKGIDSKVSVKVDVDPMTLD